MSEVKFCKMCTHPSTRPRITFNEDGICNGCQRTLEKQTIDWAAKEQELRDVIAEALAKCPDRTYDCIVPVSGGKDSTFQAWYASTQLGLKTLCVNIQSFLPTEVGAKNLRNLPERLPVDLLTITPNVQTWADLSRAMLEEFGDPWPPRQYLMFSGIARVALEKRIPLMLLGENGEREYAGSLEKEFTELDNTGVHSRIRSNKPNFPLPDKWAEHFNLPERDMWIYQEPSDADMQSVGFRRLFLSDYLPWNNNYHLHVALNVVGGFTMSDNRSVGTYTFGYSTDDDLYELYIWFLWPKYGFGRATKYTSKDIQEGKLERSKGLEMVRQYDGEFPWHALDRFLDRTGMSERAFWDVVARQISDEENVAAEIAAKGQSSRPVVWEKTAERHWRLMQTVHGGEITIELPIQRPFKNK
jgi:N-acetyl sugar amidotransferase